MQASGASLPSGTCVATLVFDGDKDIRERPLTERCDRLREILIRVDDDRAVVGGLPDPVKLLEVADEMKLEGVLSKCAGRPTAPALPAAGLRARWRAANKDRWELFQGKRQKQTA